ncbi:MAG: signal peptidase I [Anaerolineales bacterium]|nr:signal peptidase I [Anaerolineales bacterium]
MESFRTESVPELPGEEKSKVRRALLDVLETLIIAVVLFVGINAVSARIRVDSFSMEPTLQKGNFVIVNKLAYQFGSPQRGDIVVFRYPPNPIEQYIKRIIGLPGEIVRINAGQVQINGEILTEPYLLDSTVRGGEWQVPADSYFVLGDNRNNSSDSRVWGMVPADKLIGKALVIYWPPDRWNVLGNEFVLAAETANIGE